MRSYLELRSSEFEIAVEGHPAAVADLLPGFEEQSRLGIVVRDGFGAVGASTLLMATITAFYDVLRATYPDGFFRYADYFLFHVGHRQGDHHRLDVVPDHKEVVVGDDPESVVRAINDRAVTHLVVPEGVPRDLLLEAQTLNGALARIEAALVYSPDGRVADPDVEIKGNERVDHYVESTLEGGKWAEEFERAGGDPETVAWMRSRLGEVEPVLAAQILARRGGLRMEGRTVETFRRVPVVEALRLVCDHPAAVPQPRRGFRPASGFRPAWGGRAHDEVGAGGDRRP